MELFGGAGHSKEIAKRISSNGMLIGIDRDTEALRAAKDKLKNYTKLLSALAGVEDLTDIEEEN